MRNDEIIQKIKELSQMAYDEIISLIGTTAIKEVKNMSPAEVLDLIQKGWTPCPF